MLMQIISCNTNDEECGTKIVESTHENVREFIYQQFMSDYDLDRDDVITNMEIKPSEEYHNWFISDDECLVMADEGMTQYSKFVPTKECVELLTKYL